MPLIPQDIYDIAEHIVHRIEEYSYGFMESETLLNFEDYIQSRVATELQAKFSRYDIEEAFSDSRIKTIINFYETGTQEDEIFH